jgi:hypothetical protein
MRKELIRWLIVGIGLCVGSHGWCGTDVITGFHLQTCGSEGCVTIVSPRATKGYFANFYFLDGPVQMTKRVHGEVLKISAGEGYYNAENNLVMLRRAGGSELIDLDKTKATFLRSRAQQDIN